MDDDLTTLQSSVSAALLAVTRTTSSLANEDLSFHRTLDASLGTSLDRQNARLLGLASSLLGAATATTETVRPPPSLRDIEGIENNWRAVVDVVDSLLERADTALDEFTGAVKRLSPGPDAQAAGSKTARPSRIATQLKAQDMEKPQLHFEHVPKNDEQRPFKPLLEFKPHASVPLNQQPTKLDDASQSEYPHPYQLEIEQYQYPTSIYTHADPIPYHSFESTKCVYVDTEEGLKEMVAELKQAKEIAIDLEHHDQRSYIGIVSLMQISTRDRDWVVDTLKPWRRKLHVLNEVFANPNIIKVLHGAYMDIVWLQRDLGVYIVGLFDTYHACRALGYTGASLAFLLKKFVNVDAQKQYQMADWRIRPLPQELLDYARSDTHYLLYIFDCMRNELIQRSNLMLPDHEGDKIWDVLQKSSETALQRYEHPVYDAELGQGAGGWYKLLSRTPALYTKEQFSVFRKVHQWRDEVAREQDDSIHYIMPNHQVFSLAKAMPDDRASLLGTAQPTTQTVRQRAEELLAVIVRAKKSGQSGPEMMDVLNQVEPHMPSGAVQRHPQGFATADYLPKAAAVEAVNGPSSTDASALPLRSAISTFWGSALSNGANQHEHRRALSQAASSVDLRVPLPALTAEVFADGPAVANQTPVKAEPEPATPAPVEEEEVEDVFVLKELGRKRKRRNKTQQEPDTMSSQVDEVVIPDEEAERLREKAERKKARKEAKRAAKLAQKTDEEDGGVTLDEDTPAVVEDEQPFDYASAPSILNPPRPSKEQMREKRKKEVNPYAKSLDAPKGLPRSQKERAGKSMTYK